MIIFDNPATVPVPAGQYSHLARLDLGDKSMLQLSGQVAIDADGKIVGPDDMFVQTDYIMDNITAILASQRATLADVANIRSYVTTWTGFPSSAGCGRRAFPGPANHHNRGSITVVVSGRAHRSRGIRDYLIHRTDQR